jgi:hypothetical protein
MHLSLETKELITQLTKKHGKEFYGKKCLTKLANLCRTEFSPMRKEASKQFQLNVVKGLSSYFHCNEDTAMTVKDFENYVRYMLYWSNIEANAVAIFNMGSEDFNPLPEKAIEFVAKNSTNISMEQERMNKTILAFNEKTSKEMEVNSSYIPKLLHSIISSGITLEVLEEEEDEEKKEEQEEELEIPSTDADVLYSTLMPRDKSAKVIGPKILLQLEALWISDYQTPLIVTEGCDPVLQAEWVTVFDSPEYDKLPVNSTSFVFWDTSGEDLSDDKFEKVTI